MATTLLIALIAPTATAATAVGSADRTPASQGPPSTYLDPCEHSPDGTTASVVDLRELVLDGLFDTSGAVTTEPVDVVFRLCRPVDSATAPPLRVDLHPRIDTAGGADTDYAEDPTRWIVFLPPVDAAASWTWELRRRDGSGHVLVSSGTVFIGGTADAVTQLRASVPAGDVRAAGDTGTTSATGLPPIAVRGCTQDGDCGPGYVQTSGGVSITSDTGQASVDYVPEPRHLPLTYPSVCQHGPSPQATTQMQAAGTRPAGTVPGQVVVDAPTAQVLADAGWSRVRALPSGQVVLRGTPEAVRELVPGAQVSQPALRRPALLPDDPAFAAGSTEGGSTGQWSLQRLGAPAAWDVTTGSPDVLVAVLDSGFDGRHPDLQGRATAGRDYVHTRLDTVASLDVTTDTDYGGHGSFVSSLIAAGTDDGVGMAGLGWQTRLLIARVFDAESCASDASLVAAMDWAVQKGAAAINLSLGGPDPAEELNQAGQRALAAGTVPVAAAGNLSCPADRFGKPILRESYPASYPSFVSVGATGYVTPTSTGQDPIAVYSSCSNEVDVAAPGGTGTSDPAFDLLGACWVSTSVERGYCREAGTSFATPLVAATIALARSLDDARTAQGVLDLLADTALDLTSCDFCGTGDDVRSGAGRIRTGEAVRWLGEQQQTLRTVGASTDPIAAAVAVSVDTFADDEASTAVVARDDVFADTLAGAPLAGTRGPILLTRSAALDDRVAAELQRVLPRGATVRVLGGPQALAPRVADDLRALGFVVDRVAGASRIETAVEIARRVAPGGAPRVLVASAANWPDAVAGGVFAADRGLPLLLTWPNDPPQATRDELGRLGPSEIVLLGGSAAIATATGDALDAAGPWTARRVEGPHRWATATEVTRQLWGRTSGTAGDRFVLVNGQLDRGWAYGLAASPLSARTDAPLLLTADEPLFEQPRVLLRDVLRYRLVRPADGVLVGPATTAPARAAATTQRLRELLGG